jgi:hypothetical protein
MLDLLLHADELMVGEQIAQAGIDVVAAAGSGVDFGLAAGLLRVHSQRCAEAKQAGHKQTGAAAATEQGQVSTGFPKAEHVQYEGIRFL